MLNVYLSGEIHTDWREEIIQLCERLSGKTAKISYIPVLAFSLLRNFFRLKNFSMSYIFSKDGDIQRQDKSTRVEFIIV